MTAQFHPDDSTLMSYAAGSLNPALAAVVAAHVWGCAHCRREVGFLQLIGATVMRDLPDAELTRPAPVLALSSLEADVDTRMPPRPDDADIPLPIAPFAGHRLDDIEWATVSPGVQQHVISIGGNAGGMLKLLRIDPGRKIPEHGHGGTELTLVLRGAFSDVYGTFRAGDIADVDSDVDHAPRADAEVGCICLIAAETPPHFRGLIARIAQPFLKP